MVAHPDWLLLAIAIRAKTASLRACEHRTLAKVEQDYATQEKGDDEVEDGGVGACGWGVRRKADDGIRVDDMFRACHGGRFGSFSLTSQMPGGAGRCGAVWVVNAQRD